MEEKNNTLEKFKEECYVIEFKKEYPYYDGDIPFGISTSLTEEELTTKYADFIKDYTPYMLLNVSIGEEIKEYKRNEKKHQMRAIRSVDCFDVKDGEIECFHPELMRKSVEDEFMKESETENLYNALNQLNEIQRRRIIDYYINGKNLKTISEQEHCSEPAIFYSIENGIKNLRIIFANRLKK